MAESKNVVQFNIQHNRRGRPQTAPVFEPLHNGDDNPLRMVAQQIPRLTKREIHLLVERLIDALDRMAPDVDLEDDEREAERFF